MDCSMDCSMDITLHFDEILNIIIQNDVNKILENELIYKILTYDGYIMLHGSRLFNDEISMRDNYYTYETLLDLFEEMIALCEKDTVELFLNVCDKIETCNDLISLNNTMNSISF
jgi:hypothetical protein